jgi:hypothetical protein
MNEKYDYFRAFKPKRVPVGSAIQPREFVRRLSHKLQVPQSYGQMLMDAFNEVVLDTLEHGEGLRLPYLGQLTLSRYTTETVKVLGVVVPRETLYKYTWGITSIGQDLLSKFSQLDREGRIDDHFQDPNGK